MSAGGVDNILAAADKIAATAHAIDEIRALHRIATGADGVTYCAHCCLNRVAERRFSCHANHTHRLGTAPCPTLAVLGDPA
jgi:hypothetical protein